MSEYRDQFDVMTTIYGGEDAVIKCACPVVTKDDPRDVRIRFDRNHVIAFEIDFQGNVSLNIYDNDKTGPEGYLKKIMLYDEEGKWIFGESND